MPLQEPVDRRSEFIDRSLDFHAAELRLVGSSECDAVSRRKRPRQPARYIFEPPCFPFPDQSHEIVERVQTAWKTAIGVKLDEDLFDLIDGQPRVKPGVQRRFQIFHIAARGVHADRGNTPLLCRKRRRFDRNNFIKPFLHRFPGGTDASAGESRSFQDIGFAAELPHIGFAALHSASAVREERYDGFSFQVVCGQERRHRRSHRAPPVRGADEDHIVFFKINLRRQFRPETGIDLLFGDLGTSAVFSRIRFGRFDFKQRSAGCLPDHFRRRPGVAAPRITGDQDFIRLRFHFARSRIPRRSGDSSDQRGRDCTCHCSFHHVSSSIIRLLGIIPRFIVTRRTIRVRD